MLLTPQEPFHRSVRIVRFWHNETEQLFHNVAMLNLLESTITVESDQDAKNPFDEENLITYPTEEGIIDPCTFVADLNERLLFQNDIVAIWFADKVIGQMGDTPDFQINKPSDVIMHPQKRYNYFLSPVKHSRGMFYIVHPVLNHVVALSAIPQPYIQYMGNLHQDKCLIPTPPPSQTNTTQHA